MTATLSNCANWCFHRMSEPDRRKRERKKRQFLVLEEQAEESPELAELVKALEELEKEGEIVEVQVCP